MSVDARCIEGIQAHLTGTPSLSILGTSYTPVTLIALFQSHIDAAVSLTRVEDNLHLQVQAYALQTQQMTKVVRALRQWLINTFGEQSPVLADFGFTVSTPTPLTPEQLVARAAKAKATREARGTSGPRARLAVHGNVTGVSITPVEQLEPAPAAPQAHVAPAAAPGASTAKGG